MQNKGDRHKNHKRFKIEYRHGRFEIPGVDAWHTYWQEPYYLLLTIPWWGFFSFSVLAYLVVNALFAWGFVLGGDCIANAKPGSFGDAFFFSVQTITSIGYGSMYPITAYADILVTIEALIGIIGIAIITSLAFTRFSQPTAKVLFSQVATISQHAAVLTANEDAGNNGARRLGRIRHRRPEGRLCTPSIAIARCAVLHQIL